MCDLTHLFAPKDPKSIHLGFLECLSGVLCVNVSLPPHVLPLSLSTQAAVASHSPLRALTLPFPLPGTPSPNYPHGSLPHFLQTSVQMSPPQCLHPRKGTTPRTSSSFCFLFLTRVPNVTNYKLTCLMSVSSQQSVDSIKGGTTSALSTAPSQCPEHCLVHAQW